MNQKKVRFFGVGAVFFAVAVVFGLFKTNDHVECSTTVQSSTDSSGCVTVTEMHQCRERFHI